MDKAQDEAIQGLLDALSFYVNAEIYWGKPIPLELNLDRKTLKITRDSIEESPIMKDRGELARDALYNFEGVFNCTYERSTEI